ncbi:MAG: FtsW/RodA/SpoVE family cell cycle protein [Psittacicella sp.]
MDKDSKKNNKKVLKRYDSKVIWAFFTLLFLGFLNTFLITLQLNKYTEGSNLYLLIHNIIYIVSSLFAFWIGINIPQVIWKRLSKLGFILVILLFILSFTGIFRESYSFHKWLHLIGFNLEIGSVAKFFMILYFARLITLRDVSKVPVASMKVILGVGMSIILSILLLAHGDVYSSILVGLLLIASLLCLRFDMAKTVIYIACYIIISFVVYLILPYSSSEIFGFSSSILPTYNDTTLLSFVGFSGNFNNNLFLLKDGIALNFAGSTGIFLFDIVSILVLLFLCFKIFKISSLTGREENFFGAFIAFGLTIWIFFQFIIVLGSLLHIYSAIPLSFPFVGLDGSDMVLLSLMLGIVMKQDQIRRLVKLESEND